MKKYLNIVCLILVAISVFLMREKPSYVSSVQESGMKSSVRKYVVVIDPGHGGFDPGKIGINGALEKDINLSIAMKLKNFLELNDCEVIMTRELDEGLDSKGDSSKKASDMRNRVRRIQEVKPDIAISIHQNSFTEQSSKGAQVFFYTKSSEGKEMAEIIQEQLKKSIKDGNHRVSKSNDTYYLFKHVPCPMVIVECGFLSNPKEADQLLDEKYQEKMAWAIHLGVMNYLSNGFDE